MHCWPAAAPIAIRVHTAVPSLVVAPSVRPQAGTEVPVLPAVVTFCVFPLKSTIRVPTLSAIEGVHPGAACTIQDGSHRGSAPGTANRGAEPTRPMTAELTTLMGTGQ